VGALLLAGPLIVKGIQSVEDARRMTDAGVEAIVLSNHGGRQLGPCAGAAAPGPEVVDAVGTDGGLDGYRGDERPRTSSRRSRSAHATSWWAARICTASWQAVNVASSGLWRSSRARCGGRCSF